MTPEMLELLKKLAELTTSSGLTSDTKQQLELAKENLLKSLVNINQVLTSSPSEDSPDPLPAVNPSAEPELEKKSVWSKIGGVFKKVWPVASTVLLGTGGIGAIAAMAVNAVTGTNTVDPTTAASSAAAASLIGTITGAYKTTK